MNLDDAQKQQVIAWLQEGATLAELQKRLEATFGLRLTYRDVKFLVSDLEVLPKDVEPTAPTDLTSRDLKAPGALHAPAKGGAGEPETAPTPPAARVRISVDQLTRTGAVVSGNVTFSDGKSAVWSIDQMGRLGIAPQEKGYRPSSGDLQEFQMLLEQELARHGF
ncbi:MAG: hypothetical protein KA191_08120 [Verrucomicrobia bacterium]|jgi:hypothetical protein|nr:hypothetical protein [Verrucomicrobiota bacterium]MDI9382180.1 hypothetical protein [Verrucomicrobiota bacterium]NMD19892.1 hypothetical protein [Verrucomicrobiota bacterium]HNV00013.1 hypothetical protein [Verrucomicrobiota bacterium]HOA60197.1 hypothetical protein [Verrucomicrobiota bacterium]